MKAEGIYPKTVAEAVERLAVELSQEDREKIAGMSEDDLIDLHFGLGQYIRNCYSLWAGNEELKRDCGKLDADGCSCAIIRELWMKLRQ